MELGLSRSGTSSAMLISMTDTPGPSTEDAPTENEPTELSLMLERFQSNHSRELNEESSAAFLGRSPHQQHVGDSGITCLSRSHNYDS